MFKNILVPLDGSSMAETALPTAAVLAKTLHASITLIHVIERNAPPTVHGERHLTNEGDARNYLIEMAKKWFSPETALEQHVHTEKVENVADSIVSHAGELKQDLIVMCAHGKNGFHDWVTGNIAQQIISKGKTPVLLLRPEAKNGKGIVFQNLLVAFDGIQEHETGFPLVADLAKAFQARLHLVQVVHTFGTLSGERAASGRLLPATTTLMLDMAESEAEAHLQEHASQWLSAGLQVDTEVRRGDPAPQVLAAAAEKQVDLIAIGTHGKAGMNAFWAGSVASKIIVQAHVPLLIIPVNVFS
jgi:nucleotide-binding universal stress UspA family protein